jgi:hypothetical protein
MAWLRTTKIDGLLVTAAAWGGYDPTAAEAHSECPWFAERVASVSGNGIMVEMPSSTMRDMT